MTHDTDRTTGSRDGTRSGRAWTAVLFIPVLAVVGFVLGYALYGLFGYAPEDGDIPLGVDLVASGVILAAVLAPCVAAVVWGRRARSAGEQRGAVPMALGALAGVAVTALTVATVVGDAVR